MIDCCCSTLGTQAEYVAFLRKLATGITTRMPGAEGDE